MPGPLESRRRRTGHITDQRDQRRVAVGPKHDPPALGNITGPTDNRRNRRTGCSCTEQETHSAGRTAWVRRLVTRGRLRLLRVEIVVASDPVELVGSGTGVPQLRSGLLGVG